MEDSLPYESHYSDAAQLVHDPQYEQQRRPNEEDSTIESMQLPDVLIAEEQLSTIYQQQQEFLRKDRDKDQKAPGWFSTLAKLLIPSALIRAGPDPCKEKEVTQVRFFNGEALDELGCTSREDSA